VTTPIEQLKFYPDIGQLSMSLGGSPTLREGAFIE
jgi:hypothetical protein